MATAETQHDNASGTADANVGGGAAAGAAQPRDNYTPPSADVLQQAGDLKIKDESGNGIAFKSLYEGQSGRQLIIFIRHFFCGVRIVSQ